MNPFAAFLQPTNRVIQGAPSFSELENMAAGRRQEKQRALENEQQNTRANAALKLQQDYQSRKFSKEDQAEVEGLLAEYQSAEDQGDQVSLSRAAQKLKRYGMDVSPGERSPEAKGLPTQLLPNLRDFTGQASQVPQNLRDFTGSPESGLSQEDFEAQLIASAANQPSRYEQGGQTTDEFKSQIQQVDDLGDVDSPEFQAAAASESAEPVDMGDVDSPEFQAAAKAEAGEPSPNATGLPTQILRSARGATISKGGQTLYESQGPSGRWQPMVTSVFEPFTSHQTPEIAQAAQRAQAMASKLIGVDGIAPKDAIEFAFKQLNDEANRITGLERTRLGSRPRYGGGGSGGGLYTLGAGGKADAALNDDVDKVRTMWVNSAGYKKMEEQAGLLDDAEAGLMSPDGVAQNNALATLRRIQSGLTLNAQEMRDFSTSAGALENLKRQFSRYIGKGELPEEYKRQVAATMANMRRIIDQRMERGAQEAFDYWQKTRGRSAAPEIVTEKGEALRESLRGGTSRRPDPNADLYE